MRVCLYTETALPMMGGQELVIDAGWQGSFFPAAMKSWCWPSSSGTAKPATTSRCPIQWFGIAASFRRDVFWISIGAI